MEAVARVEGISLTAWLIENALPWVIGAIAAIAGLFGVYRSGVSKARTKAKLEDAAEYQRTMKEMGRVEIDDDPDDAQRWLRERGKQ